jgi:pyruvate/2-oxoglutarate dehydrogenase complex dihydrolipoamide acyltransferase (E2) component
MAERTVKLPDVGEGIAEAELVEWHVKVGDIVREDAPLGAVMTDKATVEIPSPVEGEVVWLAGKVGEILAIGSDFVRLKVDGKAEAPTEEKPSARQAVSASALPRDDTNSQRWRQRSKRTRSRYADNRPRALAQTQTSRLRRLRFGCARGKPTLRSAMCAAPDPRAGSPMTISTPISRR